MGKKVLEKSLESDKMYAQCLLSTARLKQQKLSPQMKLEKLPSLSEGRGCVNVKQWLMFMCKQLALHKNTTKKG